MDLTEKNKYLQHAIDLARKVKGSTNPNPAVGAVLVKDGTVVGCGATQPYGFDHAEVVAIKEAGKMARDATLYVTLEPCNHFGATPPCADTIIEAGIKEVSVCTFDPNKLVAGKGIEKLQAAGIRTEVGLLSEEAEEVNEDYNKFILKGIPFVTLKLAQSLDGKIATCTGDSKWITNDKSRRFAHQLRKENNAVLVGIGTVLKDDPLLNVRLEESLPLHFQPVKVILDSDLRIPLDSQIVQTATLHKTIIFTSGDRGSAKALTLAGQGIEVIHAKKDNEGFIDLNFVMNELGKRKIVSIIVEGGQRVATSFLRQGFVNKLSLFLAPIIIGNDQSKSAFSDLRTDLIKNALRLRNVKRETFDDDTLIVGYLSDMHE